MTRIIFRAVFTSLFFFSSAFAFSHISNAAEVRVLRASLAGFGARGCHPVTWQPNGPHFVYFSIAFETNSRLVHDERYIQTVSQVEADDFCAYMQSLEENAAVDIVFNLDLSPGPAVNRDVVGGVISGSKGFFLNQHVFENLNNH